MRIVRALIISLFFSSFLFANMQESKILTDLDIRTLENGIIKEAVKNKDIATISPLVLSYFLTAKSPLYKGDKKALLARANELLLYCVDHGDVSGALFLATKYLKTNPSFSRKIARMVIEQAKKNEFLRSNPDYYSLVMVYASSVLDNKHLDKEEINYTIEAIMELPRTDAQANFYLAFLFKGLDSYNLADSYLNEACHMAKQGSNIYKFCFSSEVEKVDELEDKVIKKDCKADIGQRCK